MKKLFIAFSTIILLCFFGFILQTLTFNPQDLPPQESKSISLNTEKAIESLSKAIQFQTISNPDQEKSNWMEYYAFHEFLDTRYSKLLQTLKRSKINHSLLFHWPGKDLSLKPILLSSHMDVVPIEKKNRTRWKHPPFSGKVTQEHIWGRGSLDDKGSVMGFLEALTYLAESGFQPQRGLYLVITHDEETGGTHGAALIAQHFSGKTFKLILDEGGCLFKDLFSLKDKRVALVGTAEKGYLSIELSIQVSGGHSSIPPARTAIGILSQSIQTLLNNPLPASLTTPTHELLTTLGPYLSFDKKLAIANLWFFEPLLLKVLASRPETNAVIRTTTAPTIIHSGLAENVLPANGRAVINFRTLPGESSESVIKYVKDIIDPQIQVSILKSIPASPISSSTTDEYHLLRSSIQRIFPNAIVTPFLTAGGTDSKHYAALSPHIFRFLPVTFTKEDPSRMHGINERIRINDYLEMIRFYVDFIQQATQ